MALLFYNLHLIYSVTKVLNPPPPPHLRGVINNRFSFRSRFGLSLFSQSKEAQKTSQLEYLALVNQGLTTCTC